MTCHDVAGGEQHTVVGTTQRGDSHVAGDQGFLISTNLSITVASFLKRRRNYLFPPKKSFIFIFWLRERFTENKKKKKNRC